MNTMDPKHFSNVEIADNLREIAAGMAAGLKGADNQDILIRITRDKLAAAAPHADPASFDEAARIMVEGQIMVCRLLDEAADRLAPGPRIGVEVLA